MKKQRMIVYFSGRVQGVGFRYQTYRVAREFDVCGFVKNLPDGRVLLEAEGQKEELEAFIAEIEDRLSVYIRGTRTQVVPPIGTLKGFTIA